MKSFAFLNPWKSFSQAAITVVAGGAYRSHLCLDFNLDIRKCKTFFIMQGTETWRMGK